MLECQALVKHLAEPDMQYGMHLSVPGRSSLTEQSQRLRNTPAACPGRTGRRAQDISFSAPDRLVVQANQ